MVFVKKEHPNNIAFSEGPTIYEGFSEGHPKYKGFSEGQPKYNAFSEGHPKYIVSVACPPSP